MAVPLTTPPTLTAKDIERFWSHVDQSSPDGCWPWMLGRDKDGYGKFKAQQRNLRAHRVAIFIVTGEWGEVGMHDCDNPPCCRVGTGHARPGSDAENRADMVRKGRGNAKLTEADVRAIRIERAEGATLMAIGEHFGVSFSLIYNIVKFRAWKHVK